MSVEDNFSEITPSKGNDAFTCSKCGETKPSEQLGHVTTLTAKPQKICKSCNDITKATSTELPKSPQRLITKAADDLEPYLDYTAKDLDKAVTNLDAENSEQLEKENHLKTDSEVKHTWQAPTLPAANLRSNKGRMGFPASTPISSGEMTSRLETEKAIKKAQEEEGLTVIEGAWKGGAPRNERRVEESTGELQLDPYEKEAHTAYNAAKHTTWKRGVALRVGHAKLIVARAAFNKHEADHAKVNPDGSTNQAACGSDACAEHRGRLLAAGMKPQLGFYIKHHGGEGSLLESSLQIAEDRERAHPRNAEPEPISEDDFHHLPQCQFYTRLHQIAGICSDDNLKITPAEAKNYVSRATISTRTTALGQRVGKQLGAAGDQNWYWDAGNTSTVNASKGPWEILRERVRRQRLHKKEINDVKQSTLKYALPDQKTKQIGKLKGEHKRSMQVSDDLIKSIRTHVLARRAEKTAGTEDAEAAQALNSAVVRETNGSGETRAKGGASGTVADNLVVNGNETAQGSGTETDATRLVPKARVGLQRVKRVRGVTPADAPRNPTISPAAPAPAPLTEEEKDARMERLRKHNASETRRKKREEKQGKKYTPKKFPG